VQSDCEGTVKKLLKNAGDFVNEGEAVIEVG